MESNKLQGSPWHGSVLGWIFIKKYNSGNVCPSRQLYFCARDATQLKPTSTPVPNRVLVVCLVRFMLSFQLLPSFYIHRHGGRAMANLNFALPGFWNPSLSHYTNNNYTVIAGNFLKWFMDDIIMWCHILFFWMCFALIPIDERCSFSVSVCLVFLRR